ncbi:hypothetical protein [Streptomyces tibetensis]
MPSTGPASSAVTSQGAERVKVSQDLPKSHGVEWVGLELALGDIV